MKTLNRDLNLAGSSKLLKDGVTIIDENGAIVVTTPVATTDLTTTGDTVIGDDAADTLAVASITTLTNTLTVGVDGTGYDVKLFSATSGKSLLWDESADKLIVTGATDLLGATQQTGTLTVGVDDTGHDVQMFGATSGKSLLWDESADKLIVTGDASVSGTTTLSGATSQIGALTVTAAAGVLSTVSQVMTPFICVAAADTPAPAAAIPLTNFYSKLDSNAGATTQTLAASTVKGQIKKIQMVIDGGDDVVTVTSLSGGTTITFADAGDFVILCWNGSNWIVLEAGNDADGATAPVVS